MLTRDDRTIPNPSAVCAELGGLGLEQVGFKDVGLAPADLRNLVQAIHALGAEASMELVGLEWQEEARWACRAAEAGVDAVLGGAHPELVTRALAGETVRYFPFAGEVEGHPTRLRGTVAGIMESARRLADLGVQGLDLLAYRFDGDAPALAEAVAGATDLPVVAAGGICSDEQIVAMTRAGVWGFTMGTAVFGGAYRPDAVSVRQRVAYALSAADHASAGVPILKDGLGTAQC